MNKLANFEIDTQSLPTFNTIIGMKDLKAQLQVSMIEPLKNPVLYDEIGLSAGEKCLLFGPPGCGKSFFARAIGGELKARSFELKPSSTIADCNPAASIKTVFDQARYSPPSVIIIDEVETLTEDREHYEASPYMRIFLNEMLINFDDTVNNNEKIVICGTTNSPWYIDGAFLREGRFSQAIFVPPPGPETRGNFISRLLIGQNLSKNTLNKLIDLSYQFSFADITGVVKRAKQNTVKEMLMKGVVIKNASDIKFDGEDLIPLMSQQLSPIDSWFKKFEKKSNKLHKAFTLPVQNYLSRPKKSA